MGLLIFIIIWYALVGKNSPKFYRFFHSGVKGIFSVFRGCGTIFGVMILVGLLSSSTTFIGAGFVIGVILLILSGINKNKDKKKIYNTAEKNINADDYKLPESVKKRIKIIKEFDSKYELNLTEDQMSRIAEASYYSPSWKKEVFDMNKSYHVTNEWIKTDNSWLRAYLSAFTVMQISSDFEMQKQIVEDTVKEILMTVRPRDFVSIDACVDAINRKYYTLLDEPKFMCLIRFMEKRGYTVVLPNGAKKMKVEDIDLKNLEKLYDQMDAADLKTDEKNNNQYYHNNEEDNDRGMTPGF